MRYRLDYHPPLRDGAALGATAEPQAIMFFENQHDACRDAYRYAPVDLDITTAIRSAIEQIQTGEEEGPIAVMMYHNSIGSLFIDVVDDAPDGPPSQPQVTHRITGATVNFVNASPSDVNRWIEAQHDHSAGGYR